MSNYIAFYYDPENKEHLRAAATFFTTLAGGLTENRELNGKEVENPEPVKAEKVETPAPEPKLQKVKEEEPQVEAEKAEEEEEPKKKKATPKKKAAPKKKEEPKEEVEEAEDSEGANISLDELRQALSPKVKKHKEALRDKMREMGAKNISTLEESKYGELHAFLQTLD